MLFKTKLQAFKAGLISKEILDNSEVKRVSVEKDSEGNYRLWLHDKNGNALRQFTNGRILSKDIVKNAIKKGFYIQENKNKLLKYSKITNLKV